MNFNFYKLMDVDGFTLLSFENFENGCRVICRVIPGMPDSVIVNDPLTA